MVGGLHHGFQCAGRYPLEEIPVNFYSEISQVSSMTDYLFPALLFLFLCEENTDSNHLHLCIHLCSFTFDMVP